MRRIIVAMAAAGGLLMHAGGPSRAECAEAGASVTAPVVGTVAEDTGCVPTPFVTKEVSDSNSVGSVSTYVYVRVPVP